MNANFPNYKYTHRKQPQDVYYMLILPSRVRVCLTCSASRRYLQYEPLMNDTICKLRGILEDKKSGKKAGLQLSRRIE
jgi:hypothetical protein